MTTFVKWHMQLLIAMFMLIFTYSPAYCALQQYQFQQPAISGTSFILLPGASVTVYLNGTATKASIYDRVTGSPIPNPTTADAYGVVAFQADANYSYQLVWQSGNYTSLATPYGGTTTTGTLLGLGNNVAISLTYPSEDLRGIFISGGTDNASAFATWLATNPVGTYSLNSPTTTNFVEYYFSSSFDLTIAGLNINCGGGGYRADNVHLIFAAGIDGVIQDVGSATSNMEGCGLHSLGVFATGGPIAAGNTIISGIGSIAQTNMPVPFFGVGDGVIMIQGYTLDPPLETAPGAYISATNGVDTITLASPFTITATPYYGSAYLFRLPAALSTTVVTTLGSASVTVTGGNYLWKSGDLMWNAAFPYGSTVYTATGTVGAQSLVMRSIPMDGGILATASGTSKAWMIPAAFKRRASGQSHNIYTFGWPTGMQMSCASGGGINCDNSRDYNFGNEISIIGRWVGGNNTGSSLSVGGFYNTGLRYDVMEEGSVGSTYVGETHEGTENSTAFTNIVVNCYDANYSTFIGIYQTSGSGTCGDQFDPFDTDPTAPLGISKSLGIGMIASPLEGIGNIKGSTLINAGFGFTEINSAEVDYTPVASTALPSVTGNAGSTATINDGVASPTFHQVVTIPAGGATMQKVFCNGANWLYD